MPDIEYLPQGSMIALEDGRTAKVVCRLGGGGFGTVYQVDVKGTAYALKLFKRSAITADPVFTRNLRKLIAMGSPGKEFCWPQCLTMPFENTYGYLMPLLEDGYFTLDALFGGGLDVPYHLRVKACEKIALAFCKLHEKGLVGNDINAGGIALRLRGGDIDVRVLDCDMCFDPEWGECPYDRLARIGSAAPEIGQRRAGASQASDCFSLAVLMFTLLCNTNPLIGKRYFEQVFVDEALEKKLFVTDPVFLFDRRLKNENAPDPEKQAANCALWEVLPPHVKSAFYQIYENGMYHAHHRLSAQALARVFGELRSQLVGCSRCGFSVALSELLPAEGGVHICPMCGAALPPIGTLVLPATKSYMALIPGRELRACQAGGEGLDIIAKVTVSSKNPQQLVLENCTSNSWTLYTKSTTIEVPPKHRFLLLSGMKVVFGDRSGNGFGLVKAA